jgi:hypothetical protein
VFKALKRPLLIYFGQQWGDIFHDAGVAIKLFVLKALSVFGTTHLKGAVKREKLPKK